MTDVLNTIRYMGNKTALLDNIIDAINAVTPQNGTVLDLMAGSNAVSYSLKRNFTVYTNDIQYYSYIISIAVIENQNVTISGKSAIQDLEKEYLENNDNHYYAFFTSTYSGTYFSKKQCEDIDSIRYAIETIPDRHKKALYLFALMCAMCTVQSTPGHFAQYMPSDHPRIIPLQKMNVLHEFYKKCDSYSSLYFSERKNKCFNLDYNDLFKDDNIIRNINTIYLDSPYSQEQYSRFYHILETIARYDYPMVEFKAKYRNDRFKSGFCYKRTVRKEFETIISFCAAKKINLVISYSNHGVMSLEDLTNLCNNYYSSVISKVINYKHSTQGKGTQDIKEVLLCCTNI